MSRGALGRAHALGDYDPSPSLPSCSTVFLAFSSIRGSAFARNRTQTGSKTSRSETVSRQQQADARLARSRCSTLRLVRAPLLWARASRHARPSAYAHDLLFSLSQNDCQTDESGSDSACVLTPHLADCSLQRCQISWSENLLNGLDYRALALLVPSCESNVLGFLTLQRRCRQGGKACTASSTKMLG